MSEEKGYTIERSDAEWRESLSPDAYRVLRHHGTERPGTSPLNVEKRDGVFHCAGCQSPLFTSDTKYESGSGWPSFWKPIEGAVSTTTDRSHFMTRTEVHCAACGGLATRQILWASYCQETFTCEHAAQAAGAFASFVCELAASPA